MKSLLMEVLFFLVAGILWGQSGAKKVEILSNVVRISAGYEYSLVVLSTGDVFARGYKALGQLGTGEAVNPISEEERHIRENTWKKVFGNVEEVKACFQHSLVRQKNGMVFGTGVLSSFSMGGRDFFYTNDWIWIASNVVQIAAGENFCLFLLSDGSVWGKGANWYGYRSKIGFKEANSYSPGFLGVAFKVMEGGFHIGTGVEQSFVIQSNGVLWVTGKNRSGQLGMGDYKGYGWGWHAVLSNIVDAAGGKKYSLALGGDGRLWATGDLFGTNRWVVVLSNVWKISGGPLHCLVILSNRTVWGFGDNRYGQLGTGDTNAKTNWTMVFSNAEEVACGYLHSLVVTADGVLWRTGSDHRGVVDTSYFWGEDIDAYVTRWTNGWW
jgi:alpha-tubulin suppressor-like RCC1 family protein